MDKEMKRESVPRLTIKEIVWGIENEPLEELKEVDKIEEEF